MKKFKLSVLIVMLGTLLSKVLGLVREMLLANKYGTGYISDSYIVSLNIPVVLISALAGAILNNYIPLFSNAEKESSEKAKRFNGVLLVVSFIISTILIIVFMLFTKQIVRLFAVGFSEEKLQYLVVLSRITVFCMYFIITSHIFKGYLEYRGKFFGTSLYGILMNLGMILGIYFSTTEKYYLLGYGVLFGYILSFVALLILAIKNKFGVKLNADIKNEYLKKMVILTLPILLNDVVWQINGIVDKSVASTIGEGYISAINYSHYIVDIISSVFATSLVTVFFPNVIKLFNEEGIEKVKSDTRTILKTMMFITIPCSLLVAIFSTDIVKVLFFRGAFDSTSLSITSVAVAIYTFALTFVCLKIILFKVFYALQDTKSPTESAIISIVCNIILTLVLVRFLDYKGIIIATLISSIISTVILFIKFKKKNGNLLDKKFLYNSIKICIACVVMTLVVLLLNKFTDNIYLYNEVVTALIKTAIGGIIGGVVYILSLFVLKYDFRIK